MGTFTESVTMECSPDGEPVRMWWRGLCHEIVAKPQSWYQRRPWWQDHTSLRPGEGVGYVDTQIWRLQMVRDGEPGILTMDVLLYRPSLRWRVIKVHPRVEPDFTEAETEPEPAELESAELETELEIAEPEIQEPECPEQFQESELLAAGTMDSEGTVECEDSA